MWVEARGLDLRLLLTGIGEILFLWDISVLDHPAITVQQQIGASFLRYVYTQGSTTLRLLISSLMSHSPFNPPRTHVPVSSLVRRS